MRNFINMLRDDSGAAAAEYALILAIIGSGIALAAWQLGEKIAGAMDTAGQCIVDQTSGGEPQQCASADAGTGV